MALSVSRFNASHEAVAARYDDVDHMYGEIREHRLLGFVLFLISDVVLFSSYIFAYLYLRNSTGADGWPPINYQHVRLPRFDVAFATINSVVLFGSGATMHQALESWKRLDKSSFNLWLIATIVLGCGFLGGQAYEYSHVAVTWTGSTMGASFFTLTGLHGFHVFGGVIYLIILGIQANNGVYTGSKYFGLTAGTLYWHFVDVIWVALFYLFYIM